MLISTNFALYIIVCCATNMHKSMTEKVIRAKIIFFDSNPVGRILTRFSKDLSVIDLIIPQTMLLVGFGLFRTVTVTIAVIFVNPFILIVVAFGVALMIFIYKYVVIVINEV